MLPGDDVKHREPPSRPPLLHTVLLRCASPSAGTGARRASLGGLPGMGCDIPMPQLGQNTKPPAHLVRRVVSSWRSPGLSLQERSRVSSASIAAAGRPACSHSAADRDSACASLMQCWVCN